jgi:hypothetical protein
MPCEHDIKIIYGLTYWMFQFFAIIRVSPYMHLW